MLRFTDKVFDVELCRCSYALKLQSLCKDCVNLSEILSVGGRSEEELGYHKYLSYLLYENWYFQYIRDVPTHSISC